MSQENIPDYLRTIKLGYGKGNPGEQACWMTALNSHLGNKWTDQCECVDPVINSVCISINDSYGISSRHEEERTDAIMKFGLFEPIGTDGSLIDTIKRFKIWWDVFSNEDELNDIQAWHIMQQRHFERWCNNNGCDTVDVLSAHKWIRAILFPLLRKLIDSGPCGPKEVGMPVGGVEKFCELVGASDTN